MSERTLLEAVNLALHRAMAEDPRVILLGEDVGAYGGVFRATAGLYEAYGPDRVLDMPLAETVIAGMTVGLAAQGFRPVAEVQFLGFVYPMIDQLVNHAARMRVRTRGRLTCPMVLRAPYGGGVHAPEHHSESTEALLAHVPGLRVVVPSSPRRAYGLLLSAIQDPDPVVFLEPKRIYRSVQESVEDDAAALPLDHAEIVRSGSHATLISWGAALQESLAAAERLAGEGVEVEVIDVATLKPLDTDTIVASVARTGRAVIAHEAPLTGGFGAEVAARLAEAALYHLEAPVIRITGYDTVMPLARLERFYMPTAERIVRALRSVLGEA